ncbi:hypothetical protein FF098_015800 [Parvularcula flava]|uniref:Uncharacterized protein n=1 Tax=Aquisalinus luteolus TaxID=1566827 RepID=A0ABX0HRW5_9PROT|nr:hypothetical protein [Aquisalinus luteolus]NHK29380.1 hypothetical protein [Aquisalinus luteolus]
MRGKDRLYELAFRCILEFEIQAFDRSVVFGQTMTQHEMEDRVAGEAFKIIEDHDIVMLRMSFEIVQQCDHTGTLHEIPAAGAIIGEHSLDFIALLLCIKTAAMFLTVETVALRALLHMANPAVNQRLLFGGIFRCWLHHSLPLSAEIAAVSNLFLVSPDFTAFPGVPVIVTALCGR